MRSSRRLGPLSALLLTLLCLSMSACAVLGALLATTSSPDGSRASADTPGTKDGDNEHSAQAGASPRDSHQAAKDKREPCGRFCLTEHCISAAAGMLRIMDRRADPCADFYQYACGRFPRHHPLPDDKAAYDTFSRLREDLQTHLKHILEVPVSPADSNATRNAKNLYKSCTDTNRVDVAGERPLQQLLSSLGGWPLVDPDWTDKRADLARLLANLKLYNNDVLAAVWVSADTKNSSFNVIQIDQPELGMPSRENFLQRSNDSALQAYLAFIEHVARLLANGSDSVDVDEIGQMVDFETQLANITRPGEMRRNIAELYQRMTINELSQITPQLNWTSYFERSSPQHNIDTTEPVVVYALDYLKRLDGLLASTPKRVVTNYVLWRFVKNRVSNLDRRFLSARQAYLRVLFGRQREPERWRECVTYVNGNLGMAVGALFVRDAFSDHSKKTAELMISSIRDAFVDLLDELDWMDPETLRKAQAKARAIQEKIGYPEYILHPEKLDKDYEDLEFRPDAYFDNVLVYLRHLAKIEQGRLKVPVNKTLWNASPAVVNAFYSRTKNQIIFPAGILQPPFYHQHYPKSLNYGGIGVVIGHELTHGFDDKGRQFDMNGNLRQWWRAESILHFRQKSQCIIDQYGNYTLPDVGLQLNGIMTQGENIADNGGIKQAFRAYRKWVDKHGEEPLLPGLALTHDQLFFVNYAQMWCGTMRPEAAVTKIRQGPHSPGRFRVIGTLSNSHDFARAFKCPSGSPMNPQRKCSVW